MSHSVVILVTHLLGSGHLVRARLLADSLAEAGFRTTLISGGRPFRSSSHPASWRLVQLPPLHIEGTAFSNLLDDDDLPATDELLAHRRDIIVNAIREDKPACLVTEHFPFGRRQLATEFDAAIEAARALPQPARIVASIRDILVAPSRPDRIQQANARVSRDFDAVLVHGDASIVPLSASWPDTGSIEDKLHYTGYVAAGPGDGRSRGARDASGEILVSGGGSTAALPLFAAAIAAGLLDRRHWRILVGYGVQPAAFAALQAEAAPADGRIVVERARADFDALLAACAVSVSMAGYNTMLDLARAKVPAVVVPFDAGSETEQALRAAAWAKAGIVRIVPSARLAPSELLRAVDGAAAGPTPMIDIRQDSARESARIILGLIEGRSGNSGSNAPDLRDT